MFQPICIGVDELRRIIGRAPHGKLSLFQSQVVYSPNAEQQFFYEPGYTIVNEAVASVNP